MKKTLLVALTALFAISPMMGQEETYPKGLDSGWDYTYKGVKRQIINTKMLKDIVAMEGLTNDSLSVVARRWYSHGFGEQGWGYDTIARYEYKDHKKVLVIDERLASEEYSEVLWNIRWDLYALSGTDTLKTFEFAYYSSKYLAFYPEVDSSFTAYAGHPYILSDLSNSLQLPVTYSSSNTKVASVNEKGEINVASAGECFIKAVFAGNEDVKADSAQWKLIVKDGDYLDLEILTIPEIYHSKMVRVTKANASDILGDGKLSFDFSTRTLIMNNFQWELTEEEDMSLGWTDFMDYGMNVKCPLPLAIKVVGECYVKNNSAGIFSSHDILIFGEKGSKLTMKGRFPQFSAGRQLMIDGCEVHALATTPHPLTMCETLRVEDNSFFESSINLEGIGPDEKPWLYGAMAIEGIQELILGENMALYPEGAKVGVYEDRPTIINAAGEPVMSFNINTKKVTGIDQTAQEPKTTSQKFIYNGQLFVLRDGKVYTITGQEVR